MAINQYGIDTGMWKMLPVEDQNQIIREWETAHNQAPSQPAVGGYAEGAVTNPDQVRQLESVSAPAAPAASSNPKWVFAVNLPSTYPDYAAMAATGAGLVVVADDPNAAALVAGAREHGVSVAIQVNAGANETPQSYAAKVAAAKAQFQPDRFVLDVEAPGKGVQGSPGWNFSAQAAPLVKAAAGDTPLSVTMEPNQDDYNYGAYTGVGADVWVQSYQGDMTPTDPAATKARVVANGVDPNAVTVILGPGQAAPSGGMSWASWGTPSGPAGGVYAGVATPTSGFPATTPTVDAAGQPGAAPTGTTFGVPSDLYKKLSPEDQNAIQTDWYAKQAANQGAGTPPAYVPPAIGGNAPGAITDPAQQAAVAAVFPPTGTTTTGTGTGTGAGAATDSSDWASAYFGSLGLPADVAAKVNEIFGKYPDTNDAITFALAYVRGTPWYAQTFPGIQYGMQHGLVANEQDYRQYVTTVNSLYKRYWNRDVSGSEISSYLFEGTTPDVVGKQFQGLANVMANSPDYKYYLGNFGEGQPSTDEMRALGEEQAGLDTPLGQRLTRSLNQALSRYSKMFEGSAGTPSLSLGATGLSAPSLLGGQVKPDVSA